MNSTPVPVAVGIIIDTAHRVLIGLRQSHQVGADHWEFPGGKIERDETPYEGLCRELREEINIQVTKALPLTLMPHDYSTYSVELHIFHVTAYEGTPHGAEGQFIEWATLEELKTKRFLKANQEIIYFLQTYVLNAYTEI
ncbi:MAG TPA: NUDIX domain-containing protein [Coxiellaceae bacterium]|nr:NUDIX domain-containing protein [Coxiellaceae bacterium]